jgi:hypothetical protein
LEKGEIGVLTVQFAALIFVVLLLSVFAQGSNNQSTPEITSVYWGPLPTTGHTTPTLGTGTNNEVTNATSITVFYSLAFSTHVTSVSASRLCQSTNSSGLDQVYTDLPINYDTSKAAYYFTFGSTGGQTTTQRAGWSCQYTITVTDSLEQTTTWLGTVVVKPPTTTS